MCYKYDPRVLSIESREKDLLSKSKKHDSNLSFRVARYNGDLNP